MIHAPVTVAFNEQLNRELCPSCFFLPRMDEELEQLITANAAAPTAA